MSPRPLEPQGASGTGNGSGWVLLSLLAGGVAIFAGVWVSAWVVAQVSGSGQVAPLSVAWALQVAQGQTHATWPGVSTPAVVAVALTALVVLTALAVIAARAVSSPRHRRAGGQAARALATAKDVGALTPDAVAARARGLRASLKTAQVIMPEQAGWPLGELSPRGPMLRGSWEDVAVGIFAPRSGKTTALAVPLVLDAPGAVVATSNKADLWGATAAARARVGRVWTFDPQRVAHAPRSWWWNPLEQVRGVEDAHRLAGHFVQEIKETGKTDFWASAATDLLSSLLLAAALGGMSLAEVWEWLSDATSPTPVDLLTDGGFAPSAAALRGRQAGAPETRDGIWETARTAAQCLRDPVIMSWVTPQAGLDGFDPRAFAQSTDTLYALSKEGAGAAAPLVAGLVDQVVRAGVRRAESLGGRLDPPLVLMLDEAANICKISDLPDLYSHLGSRGVAAFTLLQSYRQGTRVWGEQGMDTLWSAATVKVVGSGIDDAKFAEDLSRLVGEHDVSVRSVSSSRQGSSDSVSLRRQRILEAAAIRALPRGQALLLATGCRAAMIRLLPWYEGPRKTEIAQAAARAEDAVRAAAISHQADQDEDLASKRGV